MEIHLKIKIDLEDFIKMGKFDLLKIGMTKSEILDIFPKPEDWAVAKNYTKSNIWIYGNFEFHFVEDELYMIFNDYIDTMDGGKSLELKKWIFTNERSKTLIEIMQIFNKDCVDFEKVGNSLGQVIIRVMESDVCLTFSLKDSFDNPTTIKKEINDFELIAIHKTARPGL
ncbi:MAG: hypothetical protein R3E32_17540 [Chitinophagales bacterium]